ncbi:MAG: hypothetical protein RSF93_00325, partial [Mucinivorans sp.]
APKTAIIKINPSILEGFFVARKSYFFVCQQLNSFGIKFTYRAIRKRASDNSRSSDNLKK